MKRKMRKLLSLLISLSVMASGFSFTAFAAEESVMEPPTEISEEASIPDGTELPPDVILDTDSQGQQEDSDTPDGTEPSDSGETDPDGGETPAEGDGILDGEPPEGDGENPEEGEQPSEEGEEPSGEGEEPSDEGEEPSDEGEEPSDEGEENPDGETPASETVQAFLDAVAALPWAISEDITEEEYFEVMTLMKACQDAYDALAPEDLERGDVMNAIAKMAGLMEGAETLALVFPTDPVAKIGDIEYPLLALAVRKAAPGDTITLVDDVTESVTVTQDVTIDLDGHTWTGKDAATLTVSGTNNVTVKNGTMTAAENCKAIEAKSGTLTLDSVTFTGITTKQGAVNLSASSVGALTAEISNCTFTQNVRAIYASKANLTLNDCEIVKNNNLTWGNGASVYFSSSTVNINGGKVSDNTGVENKIIEVTGGSLVMDGTELTNNTGYGVVGTGSAANITMKNVVATGNTGSSSMNSGGSVLNANNISGKTVILENVTATGNQQTKEHGGAFYLGGGGSNANTVIEITGCTITGNTAAKQGGGIYVNNKGTTTIKDTVISGNTANWSVTSNTTTFGNAGGGLYVASTTGTVTLSGSTRIYNNETPKDKVIPNTTNGGSADIALASTTLTSSANAKNPDSYTRATLVLDGETSFTGDNGTKYTLTQFDRFLINTSNGWYYSSNKYSWPMGYYTSMEEPVRIYLGTEGQHTGDKSMTATTLADAVALAKEKSQDTVYVCGNFTVDMASAVSLNSGLTFARCGDHPNGHMFTINGTVTLDNAHIDGMNVSSNASLIVVPSNGHLTIAGDTIIENGKNADSKGRGGAIYVHQGSLTVEGGIIDNNSAREGGGIYALGGTLVSFEGGTVSNNTATGGNGGGGAYIEATSSEFGVYGGRTYFEGNVANQLGGGVFLVNGTNARTHHYIYKATFTGNKSYRTGYYYDGGAIYIQSGTTAHMKNVYVSGNTDSDSALANNNYTAVAVCPTGELAVYELDGLLSVDNNGKVDIGVVAGGTVPSVDPMVYLPSYAPGGGQIKYTYSDGTPADIDDYQFMHGYFRVQTHVSDTTKKWAKEKAEEEGVVITGNYATQFGAGIMTNGILKIGTETKSIKVEKVWEDGNANHETDQILVYLTRDGEIVGAKDKPMVNGKALSELTDEELKDLITEGGKIYNLEYLYPETRDDAAVILNAANNWSYTWTNLDPSHEWGFVEASIPGYTPTLGEEEKNTEFSQVANQYFIRKLTNTPNTEKTASLVIEKQAIGMDTEASYPFELTLKNANGAYAINVAGTLMPIYNNKVSFTLKSGEMAVVEGLPVDFGYDVTEPGYNPYVFESSTADEPSSVKHVLFVNMPTINIPVEKLWTDDLESLRPASITAVLMDGDYEVDRLVLTKDNGWKGTFENVPKFNADYEEVQYSVKELVVPDNYEASYSGDNSGLVITNAYQGGKLTLIKALNADAPQEAKDKTYTFKVTGPNGYEKEVTLKAGESKTLENLKPGKYTVVEDRDGTNIEHYTLEVTGEGDVVINPADEKDVTITNTYNPLPGGLTIKKIVTGDSAEALEKEYRFRVVGPHYDEVVTIKGNGFATITGLTPGKYTVTELDASIDGYNHTVTVTDEGNVEVFIDTDETGAEVTFTNDYKGGSLVLQKVVNADAPGAAFHNYTFRVVGPGYDEEISVPANGSVTLNGLKAGEYTVTELRDGIAIDHYTLEVTGEGTAAVTPEQTATVTITNTYKPLPGGLTIHKVVTGISAEAYDKTYYFNVTGPNGYSNRVSITGSGSVTIPDLVPGTYTVTEEDASINNYVLTVTGEGTVEVPINGGTEITIRNDYDTPYRPERPEQPEEPGEEIPEDPTPLTPPDEEIPEEEVPLAPPEEEEEEEIPEEDIPLVDAPKTGSSHHGLMAAMAALLGIGAFFAGKKRKDDNI